MQNFKQKFFPLFCTQFLGAFNDNLFKSALLVFTAFNFPENAGLYSNIIAGLFILPFFLFSATAGNITASYNRKKLVIILKTTELLLMILTLIVFHLKNLNLLIWLLFLMGSQSTFFGPVKYALLPQLLNKDELLKGNAYIEGGTYISIILGSVLGTILPFNISTFILIIMSIIGLLCSLKINNAPAPLKDKKISLNIIKDTYETIALCKKNKILFRTILGITWFWMIGAFCLTEIFPLAATILNVTPKVVSLFLLLFSLGIALGAFISNKISKTKIDLFYVPLSSIFITLSGLLIFILTVGTTTPLVPQDIKTFCLSFKGISLMFLFCIMAISGGVYVVPLNTLLQKMTPPQKLAQIIAANNIINSLGMVLISGVATLLIAFKISIPCLFLALSIFNLFVIAYISKLYPKELTKSLFRILLKALYRVETINFDNINKAGSRVIIIANHTSLLDGILIASFIPQNICFAINTEWTKHPFVQFFHRIIDFYPIDTENPLSIRNLIGEIKKNKTIMMFPEGRVSVTGNLMKVYDGAGLIAHTAKATIIPLRIEGADKSKLSYLGNILKTTWFPKIKLKMCPPVTITLDKNTEQNKRQLIADKLFAIMQDMMKQTETFEGSLLKQLKKTSITFGNKKIIEDVARHPLTYKEFMNLIKKELKAYQKNKLSLTLEELSTPNIKNAAKLFALLTINPTLKIQNKTYTNQDLFNKIIEIYYRRAVNARDNFFSELPLNTLDGMVYGLLLPLLTGAKCFLNSHHTHSYLIYDTDTTVLCLNKKTSLERLTNHATTLDFYALRKVWLFDDAIATKKECDLWLKSFAIRLKNIKI